MSIFKNAIPNPYYFSYNFIKNRKLSQQNSNPCSHKIKKSNVWNHIMWCTTNRLTWAGHVRSHPTFIFSLGRWGCVCSLMMTQPQLFLSIPKKIWQFLPPRSFFFFFFFDTLLLERFCRWFPTRARLSYSIYTLLWFCLSPPFPSLNGITSFLVTVGKSFDYFTFKPPIGPYRFYMEIDINKQKYISTNVFFNHLILLPLYVFCLFLIFFFSENIM